MGNTNLELFTDDQRLYFAKKTFIASGDVNSVRLAVEFDDTWANYPVRSGYFKYTGFGKPTIEREKSFGANNTCQIPHDVLENPGTLEVGVTGTSADGTQQKTTGLIKYRLHQGAKRPGITMSPTMDLFQQLVESVKTMTDPVTVAAMKYVAEQCQVEFERLQNEVDEVKATVNGVVLWENDDTSSEFDEQTVNVDLSEYNRFSILFKDSKDTARYMEYYFAEKNITQVGTFNPGDSGGCHHRLFTATDSGIQFGKGMSGTTLATASVIPCKIKGYK